MLQLVAIWVVELDQARVHVVKFKGWAFWKTIRACKEIKWNRRKDFLSKKESRSLLLCSSIEKSKRRLLMKQGVFGLILLTVGRFVGTGVGRGVGSVDGDAIGFGG